MSGVSFAELTKGRKFLIASQVKNTTGSLDMYEKIDNSSYKHAFIHGAVTQVENPHTLKIIMVSNSKKECQ